ncbi:metallophosphoesterase [Leptospira sp. GIMC2001]|uniref:metallophosphoesterase n=1 Tax=Leptospira sp. GIMC2001 TaxID=1513297 RepID=UPI00234A901D|nr:metallophosphoesterase [Leptospira sp. GIMC2001]WCL49445.1 metallophosphoesterase [Leptospira sp. GIMC2001]
MKIAAIGDVHGFWNSLDTDYFNNSDYDCILFTGDLKGRTKKSLNKIVPFINSITKPLYMCYGNWDSTNIFQILGEVFQSKLLSKIGGVGHLSRIKKFRNNLPNMELDGLKLIEVGEISLALGRPFSSGGPFAYRSSLEKIYGIYDFKSCIEYWRTIIDQCRTKNLIFLTHNGPLGLGDKATDIYGCDFKKEEGDWGDYDLQEIILYAKSKKINVPLVVSGHMHHFNPKTKSKRTWKLVQDGTLYINAANVPRIKKTGNGIKSHHVSINLDIQNGTVTAEEIWIKM